MAFNVDHLLNTNWTLSQNERNILQNFIPQLHEDILNTDEDINEQIAKILVLQTRRAQLVQQRTCYLSLLSPIRCLPVEIFGIIFVYATRDRPRHVLNISAVCQLWRNAALGTPVLWSTLDLGHHRSNGNGPTRTLYLCSLEVPVMQPQLMMLARGFFPFLPNIGGN